MGETRAPIEVSAARSPAALAYRLWGKMFAAACLKRQA